MKNKRNAKEDDSQTYSLIPKSVIYEDPELTTRIEYDTPKTTKWDSFTAKFKEGSMFNCILSLFSFSPILMFLFLPYSIIQVGYVFYLIILVIFALLSFYTLHFLLKIITEKKVFSYDQLLSQFLSKKITICYKIIFFIYVIGLAMIYLIISKTLFTLIIRVGELKDYSLTYLSYIFHIVGIICFQIPCLCIKDLKKVSVIEIILMGIIAITGVLCLVDFSINPIDDNISYFDIKLFFAPLNFKYIITIAVILLCFSNHLQFFQQLTNLKLYSTRRANFFLSRTVFIESFWVIIMSAICFLNFPKQNGSVIFLTNTLLSDDKSEVLRYFFLGMTCFIILIIQFNVSNLFSQLFDCLIEIQPSQPNSRYYSSYIYPILGLVIINGLTFFLQDINILQKVLIGLLGIVGGVCSNLLNISIPIFSYNQLFFSFLSTTVKVCNMSIIIFSIVLALASICSVIVLSL